MRGFELMLLDVLKSVRAICFKYVIKHFPKIRFVCTFVHYSEVELFQAVVINPSFDLYRVYSRQ